MTAKGTDLFLEKLIADPVEPDAFTYHTPSWSPLNAKKDLFWLKCQMWKDWCLTCQISAADEKKFIKSWEFGEQEPTWQRLIYET